VATSSDASVTGLRRSSVPAIDALVLDEMIHVIGKLDATVR
jgi:hypothetical protein